MNKFLFFLFISLSLPMISPAQNTKITAEEANKKGKEYHNKKNYTEAIKWYRIAAEQGHANAQSSLGVMYRLGYGVTQDYAEAVKWFRKAAEQGDEFGQHMLGFMYESGHGVTQDYAEAMKWFRKAAEQGDASSQYTLGLRYDDGSGVPQDYTEALKWYQKAAEQGNEMAMNRIGDLFFNGNGVPQNYQTAKEWYQKAISKKPDFTLAKINLARVEKKIAEQSGSNNNSAQNSTITQPKTTPQPKVETFFVDTDIPVISRVNRNTFAIIIANEDYMDEAKVDFAKNDGEVFKNYCHKTLGLPETNIHYLPNATLAKMFGELDWLRQVCEVYKGEANVIFYYSGHGFPDEKSHAAYIIPVDGNKRLLRTCFSVSELYEMLGSMPSKRVTVLMDACFSGAKRSGDMLASAKGVAIKVKYGAPKGNTVVMAAAQGDETAYFNKEAKHGLFTYFLLKKLKETKGSVTLGDLSSYIQEEVSKYSIVVNGKSQTPSVQASDKLAGSWQSLNF
jgi:TPR repeat protein